MSLSVRGQITSNLKSHIHTQNKKNNTTNTVTDMSTSGTKSPNNNTIGQYNADARLMAEFEHTGMSGELFNYSRSVLSELAVSNDDEIRDYLERIQRGGYIQSFGCMVTVEQSTYKILAFSENIYNMLGLRNLEEGQQQVRSLMGIDVRTLFTPPSWNSLTRAIMSSEITSFNPIWVHSKGDNRPFYAILHRIDVGVIIDLEPCRLSDPTLLHYGTLQTQKLAAKAVSRLKMIAKGDTRALCDTLVEEVRKLTRYDRVMVYKFHEDNHGEVVSEIRKMDLEPFLGVHYPAVDIPQAARFLFMQNRVRMICDCSATPVKVIQSEALIQPVCLVNSTLRDPHQCHAQYMSNMGTIASLVMPIRVKDNDDSMKLWGLVVCHHSSPRYTPYPLRFACESLMNVFCLLLQLELHLEAQVVEKNVLRLPMLLCDKLLRAGLPAIMNQSPNIMDLVKCDGAALYYNGKCWFLGVTPTESQLQDIIKWLLNMLDDSIGLRTDSLVQAGYPGAAELGDAVCGMAAARLTALNFVFWFRSNTAKELRWGGARHKPNDNGGQMHPSTSFQAFLEVVKYKSLPWEAGEINAIVSLQLMMMDYLTKIEEGSSQGGPDVNMDGLSSKTAGMARSFETAAAPIFGVDSAGVINGWNSKMCELTELEAAEALGKSLIDHVVHEDSRKVVEVLLASALQGKEDKDIVEVKLRKFGVGSSNAAVYIVINACTSRNSKNDVVGACFVGQDVTAQKMETDKFMRMQGDYNLILESANHVFPPMFASDANVCCCEWNGEMEELTGWTKHEVIGKLLPGDVFGNICQVKSPDLLTEFMILLYRAIGGHDDEKLEFGFFNKKGEYVDVHLTATKIEDANGKAIGCMCFLQMSENKSTDDEEAPIVIVTSHNE